MPSAAEAVTQNPKACGAFALP